MLSKPVITEKSTKEAEKGRYAFKVGLTINKSQVKNEVEQMFGVHVIKVQTLVMPGKTRRAGKRGQQKQLGDWKKAIVTLKTGEKLDIYGH